MMNIIAIANRKGGSGKTTTAVNLGTEWARRGYKTLLIDLDTQSHASIGLGCGEFKMNQRGIHKVLYDRQNPSDLNLSELIQSTSINNLSLIPGDTDIDESKKINDLYYLKNLLSLPVIQNSYDRVIIDTPPTLDSFLISALISSQGVLVPFVPHYLAQVGVKQLARLFYHIAVQYNSGMKLLGLIPIMYDRRLNLHKAVINELSKQFGQKKLLRGIRNNIALAEAFAQGMPVTAYKHKSSGAMDYYLLAEEVELLLSEHNRF